LSSVELPTMFVVQLGNCCDYSSVFQKIGNCTGHSLTTWLDGRLRSGRRRRIRAQWRFSSLPPS